MTENEKITFGATIEGRPANLDLTRSKTSSVRDAPPSPLTTSSSIQPPDSADHFNALHGNKDATETSSSCKQSRPATHDLESQHELGPADSESRLACRAKEDSMWPSLKAQKARAKQQKQARSCNPMSKMGRRQKLIATAVIALLIIGAAVGIGVGISKAVGGGVSRVGGGTRPIGGG